MPTIVARLNAHPAAAGPEPAGGRGLLEEETYQRSARAAALNLPALAECRRVS